MTKIQFTAGDTRLDNLDTGIIGQMFHLQNGGNTKMTTKFCTIIMRPLDGGGVPSVPK